MDLQPANTRLIDHFKRVYTIIVGLAITEGCKHLWPLDPASIFEPNVWMFLAFFITVIPIFHGGDRALDHKYSEIDHTDYFVKDYLWEIYMLLFMSLGFVLVAEAIPLSTPPVALAGHAAGIAVAERSYAPFFFLFGATLAFDVLVLGYGLRFGSRRSANRASLEPYPRWIKANALLSSSAFALGAFLTFMPSRLLYDRFDPVALLAAVLLFVAAVWRTHFDYQNAEAFMFPGAAPQSSAATPQP
jgi:hypothetical protein